MKYYTIYDSLNGEAVLCSCTESVFKSKDGMWDFTCVSCGENADDRLMWLEPKFQRVEKPTTTPDTGRDA